MKKYFMMAALMCMGALCLTSCGDDDKDEIDDIIDDVEQGTLKPTTKFEEKGNQMILTITWKNVDTQVQTATLQNDICESYIVKDTYASTKLADEAWKEVQKDKDYAQYVTRDGKTITQDLTEEFKGLPKEVLRGVMQNMAQEMERGITK